MIERFNFYDIYGYLLPGTLLFGLFWLPFGLSTGKLPTSEISATLLLLVPAYIAGHLLQTVGNAVFPSKALDTHKALRERSEILLDIDNGRFTEAFKDDLGKKVKDAFQIVGLKDDSDRKVAFFAARAYLIRNKAANYVEQFEGMYAMMRGLGCAFYVGIAYLVGWGLSFHWKVRGIGLGLWWLLVVSSAGTLIAAVVAWKVAGRQVKDKDERIRQEKNELVANRWLATFALLLMGAGGYFVGTWKSGPGNVEFFLWVMQPVLFVAGIRCLQAYRFYAQHFAETVWRDFAGLYGDKSQQNEKKQEDDDRK